MLIKLHWRCASNPNKVCFLQKSNGSSNGQRGVKVEGRVSLPSGKICMGSFSQQMSTASRNPAHQVRLCMPCSLPLCIAYLHFFRYQVGWVTQSSSPPPPFLSLQKPVHVSFQSLSWDMEIKKSFSQSHWSRLGGQIGWWGGDDARPTPSPSSAGSAPDSINGPTGLPRHGLSPQGKYPPGWSNFPHVRKNKRLRVVKGWI